MWLPKVALGLFGLTSQQQFVSSPQSVSHPEETMISKVGFELRSGSDILSPQDMLSLPRPGNPLANTDGDLALIPLSQYSFDDRKRVTLS